MDELTDVIFTQIDSLKSFGTTELYITKVAKKYKREHEINLQKNRVWLNSLEAADFHGLDSR